MSINLTGVRSVLMMMNRILIMINSLYSVNSHFISDFCNFADDK